MGIEAPGLVELVARLSDFDDPGGLPDDVLDEIAAECEAPATALAGLRAMGLLEQVQSSGEPRWRVLEIVRAIVAPA